MKCDAAINRRPIEFRKVCKFPTISNVIKFMKYRKIVMTFKKTYWRQFSSSLGPDTLVVQLWRSSSVR